MVPWRKKIFSIGEGAGKYFQEKIHLSKSQKFGHTMICKYWVVKASKIWSYLGLRIKNFENKLINLLIGIFLFFSLRISGFRKPRIPSSSSPFYKKKEKYSNNFRRMIIKNIFWLLLLVRVNLWGTFLIEMFKSILHKS